MLGKANHPGEVGFAGPLGLVAAGEFIKEALA